MKLNVFVNTEISIGDVFYVVNMHLRNITAHRCERIVVTYDMETNSGCTSVEYIAKGDAYRYEAYEIYSSYAGAEAALHGDDNNDN